MRKSILSLILSLGALMLAGCATFRSSSSARVQPLENSLVALKTEFNRDTSKPRLLALFSPTCGGCLYGARALQQQAKAVQSAAGGPRILVVWLPMLETDDKKEARNSARKFHFRGAHHFYDADKQTSARLMTEQFPHAVRDALEVLPPGHPKRKALETQKDLPPEKVPLWDALLVFPPGVRWDERSPAPIWWTRQIGFNGDGKPGELTGLFWKNDPRQLPVKSDWDLEAREALRVAQQSNSDRK